MGQACAREVIERGMEDSLGSNGSNLAEDGQQVNPHKSYRYPQLPRERRELNTPPRLQGRSRVFAVGHSRD